ncbi:MAG: hypothetical protein ACI4LA_06090 [Emergencia sp.]
MILTFERAADGEIAAGKDRAEWTPEGKPNAVTRAAVSQTPFDGQ